VEIVDWQGTRLLRATSPARLFIPLPEVLPQRYTIEMDAVINNGDMQIWFGDNQNKRVTFGSYYHNVGVYNAENGVHAKGNFADKRVEQLSRLRLLVDGNYMKVYVNDRRILNVPNANMERSNKISFWIDAADKYPALIGNIRIAAGGKKLYDALAETGRVATQGIYFDTGSERIRPESTPTLKEIAAMLKEHSDLRLTIEGHTDNVGAAAANQTLSEKRAAAVKAALVSQFGADADRLETKGLETKGLGATKPLASNNSPEGRQQNRRVELVRM
jgi:OOP family OmpA-OmpF porin